MARETYDVAVLGLGGMGSAALYHLAKRGESVCGIERFGMGHEFGSSHGATRIIRKAYFEHPDYVPLLNRAYELWADIETESERTLFEQCGLVVSGLGDSEVVQGLEACYKEHALPHEHISAEDAQERYERFRFPSNHTVFIDPVAGFLHVERCVETYIQRAQAAGARVLIHEDALAWRADESGVVIKTANREIHAGRLIVCAGAWAKEILAEVGVPLAIRRKVQAWFRPKQHAADATKLPVFYFDMGWAGIYGTPAIDDLGVKLAEHTGGDTIDDPDAISRTVTKDDTASVHRLAAEVLPDFRLRESHVSVCMYTMTPDEHFIVDRHPEHDNVFVAAGFSGHGFKFASVIGEVLAQLASDGRTDHPIGLFRLNRPVLKPPATPAR